MNSPAQKVGVFDSGVGGLTVVKEIFRKLPQEEIVYFGDTGRFPYGTRSKEVIQGFSEQAVKFLLGQDVKIIVVACNTASAQALSFLKQNYPLPILGVIEPGVKKALATTKNKRIGVIGTEGTVASNSYPEALRQIDPSVKVFSYPCPLFVSLAEEGYINKKATYLIAQDYLKPLIRAKVDTIILGCTHYPLLKNVIQKVVKNKVKLVDSAEAIALETKKVLEERNLLNNDHQPHPKFYVSDLPEKFIKLARRFIKNNVNSVERIDINKY
ncbi:MAG: Glutamate racemase [candidate division Zixibacteria bacterium RBG-1]|nr:MAG: Glutamate racemase [candidate division Zixibacteria bacterium RBG-1]OGC86357.1 MAG: glutamate racemase [candidate division Zixibacteria bacterium RBG_19FT_COMBO_42_43]